MNKEQISKLVNENPDVYTQLIKCHHKEIYQHILKHFNGKKFGEKLYKWIHHESDNTIGHCKKCNNECRFISITRGYSKYCSKKCSNQDTVLVRIKKFKKENIDVKFWEEKKCKLCNKSFSSLRIRNQLFCSNVCSNQFTANNKNRLDNIKKTKLERYGCESFINFEKYKQTCLKKYGVDNVSKTDAVKTKLKYNSKKRFLDNLKNHKLSLFYEPMFDWDSYIDTNKNNQYDFKCKKCNGVFKDHIDGGHLPRCLNCYPYLTSTSNIEKEIFEYIKQLLPNESIESSNRNIIPPMELDIYIPNKKIAIELNGLYWHSEIKGKKNKWYHFYKTKKCKEQGIKLIHIFEDLWINKQHIVKEKIKYLLKLNEDTKIYARNCVVGEISFEKKDEFIYNNHLQGKDKSSIHLGLFYNTELVSVMTFGSLRVSMGNVPKENVYEMYRFCSNKTVVGAAGKLFSHFVKKYNPNKVISYADKCWSQGDVYMKIGFKQIAETPPNYFYLNDYTRRYGRFNFRKDQLSKKLKLFNIELSEWENMQLNGFDRIWDCGNLKYEWVRY